MRLLATAHPPRAAPAMTPAAPHSRGEWLATQYCQRCHLLPDPHQLPREAWPYVLNAMGNYLGYPSKDGLDTLAYQSWFALQPMLPLPDLLQLRRYYLDHAPTAAAFAVQPAKPRAAALDQQFDVVEPPVALPPESMVTLVRIDSTHHRCYIGASDPASLTAYDPSWSQGTAYPVPSPPVGVAFGPEGLWVDCIGDLWAGDHMNGTVLRFPGAPVAPPVTVVEHYYRLTQHLTADLDGDGIPDLVVVGFGNTAYGRVSIRWGGATGPDAEQDLVTRSGAICATVCDLEGTGRKDILVLMAQGRDQLLYFRNLGHRQFECLTLQEWPSSFGPFGMAVADVDGDGKQDIVVVNGDSVELPDPPLRPYHGVHVLTNRGGLRFEETYFYPMYGASCVKVAPITGSGRQDIAIGAFSPDWRNPAPETFTLLTQRADGGFTPSTLGPHHLGRWLVMDVGDLTGDGRLAIVLGGGVSQQSLPPAVRQTVAQELAHAPRVLLLRPRAAPPRPGVR